MNMYDVLLAKKLGGGTDPSQGATATAGDIALGKTAAVNGEMITGTSIYSGIPDASITGDIVIPNGVTSIKDGAFWQCSNIENLDIAGSVVTIGEAAFRNCTKIKSITLHEGTTTTGTYCFRGCDQIESFVFPNSLVNIGNDTLRDCTKLKSVTFSPNLAEIPNYCCTSCALSYVKIPGSVTRIGMQAFEYNRNLNEIDCTELTISNGNVNTTLGNNAFRYTSSSVRIVFADEATMNVYAAANNWSTYASKMTYVGA